jgi:flagellar motility protein MotE (MotC chaperone)
MNKIFDTKKKFIIVLNEKFKQIEYKIKSFNEEIVNEMNQIKK